MAATASTSKSTSLASLPSFGRSISFQSRMSSASRESSNEAVSTTSVDPIASSSTALLQPGTSQISNVNTSHTLARSARSRTRSVSGVDGQKKILSHGNEALLGEHSRGPGTPDFTLGDFSVSESPEQKNETSKLKRSRALTGECFKRGRIFAKYEINNS